MAINPESQFPGQITPSSPDYPYGEARNVTAPDDGTGTPLVAALVNDIFGFQQALLSESNIVPTGNPETALSSQYLDALKSIFSNMSSSSGRGVIYGLTTFNSGAEFNISTLPGLTNSNVPGETINLPATIFKQGAVPWAIGNVAGGEFGLLPIAGDTRHLFVIKRDSDGLVDAGFSTHIADPVDRPPGWNTYQRIMSFRVNASGTAFTQYVQLAPYPEVVKLKTPEVVYTAIASTTAQLVDVNVPKGDYFLANLTISGTNQLFGTTGLAVIATSPTQPDVFPINFTINTVVVSEVGNAGAANPRVWGNTISDIITDFAGQIRIRSNMATPGDLAVRIQLNGWTDLRGKFQ